MNLRYKLLILALVILTCLAAFFSATINTSNIQIEVAPITAAISIDGKPVKPGKHYVEPGEHTVSATLIGFEDASQKVEVNKNKIVSVELLLNPNSQAGLDYLKSHPEDQLRRERLGGKKFDQANVDVSKENPLISSLPFIDRLYRVDYGASIRYPKDPNAVVIYITYFEEAAKLDALDWIRAKGYDPDTMEIIYVNGNADDSSNGD